MFNCDAYRCVAFHFISIFAIPRCVCFRNIIFGCWRHLLISAPTGQLTGQGEAGRHPGGGGGGARPGPHAQKSHFSGQSVAAYNSSSVASARTPASLTGPCANPGHRAKTGRPPVTVIGLVRGTTMVSWWVGWLGEGKRSRAPCGLPGLWPAHAEGVEPPLERHWRLGTWRPCGVCVFHLSRVSVRAFCVSCTYVCCLPVRMSVCVGVLDASHISRGGPMPPHAGPPHTSGG